MRLLPLLLLLLGWVTPGQASDLNPLDRLGQILAERLVIMEDVAKYKWSKDLAVEDREREAVIIQATIARAVEAGLDTQKATLVITAQMNAAKSVQLTLYQKWEATGTGPFHDAPSLTEDLRPEISRITAALVDAVKQAELHLPHCDFPLFQTVPEAVRAYPAAWRIAVNGLRACDENGSGGSSTSQ